MTRVANRYPALGPKTAYNSYTAVIGAVRAVWDQISVEGSTGPERTCYVPSRIYDDGEGGRLSHVAHMWPKDPHDIDGAWWARIKSRPAV